MTQNEKKQTMPSMRVLFNQDDSNLFGGKYGPPSAQTVSDYVDSFVSTGVTDLLINVNTQRTIYRSDVWEAYWDGYDPTKGDDQPFFAGRDTGGIFGIQWYNNLLAFHEQGCDYPEHMIRCCRQNSLRPWISIRMNDSHHAPDHDHPYHSTFWREHPQWWVVPYRFTTWYDRGLDYGQQEVRDHYMTLIKEVCERYDMDGLELDFHRFVRYFRPGHEQEGTKLMNTFVAEVRRVVEAAEKRWGHEIELGVRVPNRPQTARGLGLDAIAWGKQGLIDMVIAGSDVASCDSDIPVELWHELLAGTSVPVAAGFDSGLRPDAYKRVPLTVEDARGLAVAALHRGADAIYLFNFFAEPLEYWEPEVYKQFLSDAGSREALRRKSRRHVVTLSYPFAEGEPRAAALPYTVTLTAESGEAVQVGWGVFRLYTGPRPMQGESMQVRLEIGDGAKPDQLRLNGTPCPWQKGEGQWHTYDVPAEAINEGYNVIEVGADEDLTIRWVEIAVQ